MTGKNLSLKENQHPIDQIDVATIGEAVISFADLLRKEKENESPLEKQQKTKKDAAAEHAGKKRTHDEADQEGKADNDNGEDSNAAATEDNGSEMVVYEWDCDRVRRMIRGFLEENGTRESPLVSHFSSTGFFVSVLHLQCHL